MVSYAYLYCNDSVGVVSYAYFYCNDSVGVVSYAYIYCNRRVGMVSCKEEVGYMDVWGKKNCREMACILVETPAKKS